MIELIKVRIDYMLTFEELYKRVAKSSETKEVDEILSKLQYNPYHLECILHPEKMPYKWESCHDECKLEGKFFINCFFNHLGKDEENKPTIDFKEEKCTFCMDEDKLKKLVKSKDIISTLEAIHKQEQPVYAIVAPAFLSQFDIVHDGQLRAAFKQIGFAGMVEVSLFADILTLKEALEFDKDINKEEDFQLTSCCCPVWINLIRKVYPELLNHVPNSVSPMVATGRVIKKLVPDAFVVFVGPCLAKKSEAKEEDVKDAVDIALTFQEVNDLFEAARVDAEKLKADLREHSSVAGRIYAITSGVSEAVGLSVKKLRPEKPIQVKAIQANGVVECRKLLKDIEQGDIDANFIEGMGCVGGCVGGPRSLIDTEVATEKVRKYADESLYETPINNPYVIEILHRLNITTIEQLLEENEIFTRYLSTDNADRLKH